jgi:hypothetical protein
MVRSGRRFNPARRKGEEDMKQLIAIAALFLAAMLAYAADVTGKWKATVEGPNGSMELVFNLKCDGERVTGTVTSQMGEMSISDGTLKGDDIVFTVSNGDFSVVHKGKVSGDEMKLTADIGDQQMELTAKRVKE